MLKLYVSLCLSRFTYGWMSWRRGWKEANSKRARLRITLLGKAGHVYRSDDFQYSLTVPALVVERSQYKLYSNLTCSVIDANKDCHVVGAQPRKVFTNAS